MHINGGRHPRQLPGYRNDAFAGIEMDLKHWHGGADYFVLHKSRGTCSIKQSQGARLAVAKCRVLQRILTKDHTDFSDDTDGFPDFNAHHQWTHPQVFPHLCHPQKSV
jgi:hypothetical protein